MQDLKSVNDKFICRRQSSVVARKYVETSTGVLTRRINTPQNYCYVRFEIFVSVVCSAPLALVCYKHCRG